MVKKIGILGGIGPEASAKFYELLINKAQSLGLESNTKYPHIFLESIPAPELFLENPDLTMYKEGIKNLEKAGADFIVIICNTAYLYIDEFKKLINVPIIDLNKETEGVLGLNNVRSIMVFGSHRTINKLFTFGDILVKKPSNEDSAQIDKIILEYNCGKNVVFCERQLRQIISKYPRQDVLIACTELSVMLKNKGLKYFDTFDILLEATFKKWKVD